MSALTKSLAPVRQHLVLILSAVMLAIGVVGLWAAYDLRSADSAKNLAVVDQDATSTVQSEVSQALTSVLSYDYSDPAPTQQAADDVLAGDARTEYDKLFTSLQERAPGQQLTLTAQVQVAAVKNLTDTSAELLVFLDQSSQRATDKEASVSAAQLSVKAKKVDGRWKVTGLTPL